jgi:hypothetical protein
MKDNFVAKHAHKANKAVVHVDKTKQVEKWDKHTAKKQHVRKIYTPDEQRDFNPNKIVNYTPSNFERSYFHALAEQAALNTVEALEDRDNSCRELVDYWWKRNNKLKREIEFFQSRLGWKYSK